MERLKSMKESLITLVQQQISGNLNNVDTKELGEAIDAIHHIAETMYYCAVVEAMEGNGKTKEEHHHHYTERYIPWEYERGMDKMNGKMYYDERYYGGKGGNRYYNEREYPIELRDYREGTSSLVRKNYMEGKEQHHTKEKQMAELEKYMKELSHDITDMIKDASPEERTMLKNKIAELSTKIS